MQSSSLDLPFEVSALEAWMDREGLGQGALRNLQPLTGGTQNILVKFERAGRDYVLRRPPRHVRANSNETMRREALILGALARTDVPHARLIAACGNEQVLGAAFYLMEPVDGFNAANGLPEFHAGDPDIRWSMGLAMIDALLRLGELDYEALGITRLGDPADFPKRQVARWSAQLESYKEIEEWPGPVLLPHLKEVTNWLNAHVPPTFQPGLMHGDYHIANVMFEHNSPNIAAIVDWELATIGDPLLDLGALIIGWPGNDGYALFPIEPSEGFPSIAQLVEHYSKTTSRGLDDLTWYIVLAGFRGAVICEGTHARACAGKVPRALGEYMHKHAVQFMKRAAAYSKHSGF